MHNPVTERWMFSIGAVVLLASFVWLRCRTCIGTVTETGGDIIRVRFQRRGQTREAVFPARLMPMDVLFTSVGEPVLVYIGKNDAPTMLLCPKNKAHPRRAQWLCLVLGIACLLMAIAAFSGILN